MVTAPYGVRLLVGAATVAVEETIKLPKTILMYPMTLASQAAHITGGAPLGNAYVSEEAFRWVAWAPSDATVDLVSAGPGSQGTTVRATTRVEVVWSGGDWLVVAPPGGDWGNAAAALPSLSGYTVFPGQG